MNFDYQKLNREDTLRSAKKLLDDTIWKHANIEIRKGVTFPETKAVLEGFIPGSINFDEALTINNIKRAWRYLLENPDMPVGWSLISEYNRILGEGGLVDNAGGLRSSTTNITGTNWRPELPDFDNIMASLTKIDAAENPVYKGLLAFSEVSKGQWFNDGNKRTATMIANHALVQAGVGIFAPPVNKLDKFFDSLIGYYEGSLKQNDFLSFIYHDSFELIPSGLTPEKIQEAGWANVKDFIKENTFTAARETLSIEERLRQAEKDKIANKPRNKFEERLIKAEQEKKSISTPDSITGQKGRSI